jgi:TP901 family phage tail tape measure protein
MADIRNLSWLLKVQGADEAAKAVEGLDSKVDKAKSGMLGLEDRLGNLGDKFIGIGGKLGVAGGAMTLLGAGMTKATAPLKTIGSEAFNWAKDLDTAVRQVSTLTTDGILPVDKIKKEVRAISDETGRAQTEVANAMYEALSSGVDESKVVGFVKKNITLSEAGFADLGTSIDATTTILNAYGNKAFDVGKISDILVKTQDKGKITVDELAKSIGRVIPTAAAAGVNVDQLGAAYSILTAKGMNARIATTNLEGMLSELSTTGSKVDKVIRMRTGKSFARLSDEGVNLGEVLSIVQKAAEESGLTLKDMFGQSTAGSAALSLMSDGVKGYTDALGAMNGAQGAAAANAENMHGDEYNWGKAMEQIKNTLIDLGNAIAPVIIPIAQEVSGLIAKFSDLSPETKDFIVHLGLIAVAAGPVLMMLGNITMGVGGLMVGGGLLLQGIGFLAGSAIPALGAALSFLFSPMGLILGAISLLSGLSMHLCQDWGNIQKRAKELGGGIKGHLLAALESAHNYFKGLWDVGVKALNGIKSAWESVKNAVKNPIKGAISFIGQKLGIGGGNKQTVPSHAKGLDSVPYNDYTANLHAGEMILTKKAASLYRALGGNKDRVPIYNTYNNNNSRRTYDNAPVVNINVDVKGNADRNTADNIATKVREEIDEVFRELQLQRV